MDDADQVTGFIVYFEGASNEEIATALTDWDGDFDQDTYTPFEGVLYPDGSSPDEGTGTEIYVEINLEEDDLG